MKKSMILLDCLIFGCFIKSNAQACVYFDPQTTAMGYAYGNYNACYQAFQNCKQEGGQTRF